MFSDRKATISCLQTATSKGCNGVKTVEAIASKTVAAIDSTCGMSVNLLVLRLNQLVFGLEIKYLKTKMRKVKFPV